MLSQNPPHQAMQQTSPANGANTQAEQQLRAQLEFLQQRNDAESSATTAAALGSRNDYKVPTSRPPNGFDVLASPAPDVSRLANAAAASKSEPESHIHPDLRAPSGHAPIPNMMPIPAAPSHSAAAVAAAGGPSVTPLAPAPPPSMSLPVDDESPIDGRKAKRELSQSKRAAQNRAAQRAFRQRKEGYIKKLEQQVRDFEDIQRILDALRSENKTLRDYVTQLQGRLLEVLGDCPAPPPGISLLLQASASTAAAPPPGPHEPASASHGGEGSPLEAVAQAVAGLAAQENIERHQSYPSPPFKTQQADEDTRTTEEINRQLNPQQPSAQT